MCTSPCLLRVAGMGGGAVKYVRLGLVGVACDSCATALLSSHPSWREHFVGHEVVGVGAACSVKGHPVDGGDGLGEM